MEEVGDSGVNVGNDLGSLVSQEPGDVALGAKGDAEDLQAVMSIYLLPLDAWGRPLLSMLHVLTVGLGLVVVVDVEVQGGEQGLTKPAEDRPHILREPNEVTVISVEPHSTALSRKGGISRHDLRVDGHAEVRCGQRRPLLNALSGGDKAHTAIHHERRLRAQGSNERWHDIRDIVPRCLDGTRPDRAQYSYKFARC